MSEHSTTAPVTVTVDGGDTLIAVPAGFSAIVLSLHGASREAWDAFDGEQVFGTAAKGTSSERNIRWKLALMDGVRVTVHPGDWDRRS